MKLSVADVGQMLNGTKTVTCILAPGVRMPLAGVIVMPEAPLFDADQSRLP